MVYFIIRKQIAIGTEMGIQGGKGPSGAVDPFKVFQGKQINQIRALYTEVVRKNGFEKIKLIARALTFVNNNCTTLQHFIIG